MLALSDQFDRDSFLKQGAIFSEGPWVWLFWGDFVSQAERPAGPALYRPRFWLEDHQPWKVYPHSLKVNKENLLPCFNLQTVQVEWFEPNRQVFHDHFVMIQNKMEESLEKAVPFTDEHGQHQLNHNNWVEHLIHAGLNQQQGYLYGAWDSCEGLMGLTPETLVRQKSSGQFTTMALAGTSDRTSYELNPTQFTNDPKEVHEHQCVVEGIRESLHGFGELSIGEMDVRLTPTLAHLYTAIELSSDRAELQNLVRQLHPTPALGVRPRLFTEMILKSFESELLRGEFGAPFGFSESKECGHILVAIRHVRWVENNLSLPVGCGVVRESNEQNEWNELERKRQSVKRIFSCL